MGDRIAPQVPIDFSGLAILGECPGEEEIKQGQPFVGIMPTYLQVFK